MRLLASGNKKPLRKSGLGIFFAELSSKPRGKLKLETSERSWELLRWYQGEQPIC